MKPRRYSGNPYRFTLARNFPEPAIVMLCFLWVIHLFDGYFAPPAPERSDTQALAFESIDRQLRLADSFAGRPAPLRWFAGVPTLDDAIDRATRQLKEVWLHQRLDSNGAVVHSILLATAGKNESAANFVPAEPSLDYRCLDALLREQAPSAADLGQLQALLATDAAHWWHLAMARSLPGSPGLQQGIQHQLDRGDSLARKVFIARSLVWLLVLAGAFFTPAALRLLSRGARRQGTGYVSRWPFRLSLGVFLVAALVGFGMSRANGFFAMRFGGPDWLPILVEIAAGLLPAALACAFLFHRPRHAIRCFGITRPVSWAALWGLFTLVFLLQETLHLALADLIPVDPTGGFDPGAAGWQGLLIMLVSACLVAPVGEELLYRGVLFQGFANRFNPLTAAAASALVFTVVHFYGLYGTLSVGILGIALALAYNATRSLTAVIVFHSIYNLTVTIPEWIADHAQM